MPIVFHSDPLRALVQKLDLQCDILARANFEYLSKKVQQRHFEDNLILKAPGKSHAERSVQARSSDDWLAFHLALARIEAVYDFQKLKYEVLKFEYQAEYLTRKIDSEVIKKQGGL